MTQQEIYNRLDSIANRTACIADSCRNLHTGNVAHKSSMLKEVTQRVHNEIMELLNEMEVTE